MRVFRVFSIVACCLAALTAPATAQTYSDIRAPIQPPVRTGSFFNGYVQIDRRVTEKVLDFQEGLTGDTAFALEGYAERRLKRNTLYVGGLWRGGAYFEWTNEDGKYPILSRFPFQHGDGGFDKDLVTQNAAISLVANFQDWLTLVSQIEYSEVFFRPDQDDIQFREAYGIIGNLRAAPVYAAIGRKTVAFGEFDTYSPFTHSVNQHFFWTQSDDPVLEVGYINDGWQFAATALSGARQFRVAMSDNDDFGGNFALKAKKIFSLGRNGLGTENRGMVSVSYLDDTIYNNNFTAHTIQAIDRGGPPNAPEFPTVFVIDKVGLVSVAAAYNSPRLDLMAEYTRATDDWPGTSMSGFTGEVYDDVRRLQAVTLQGRYIYHLLGREARASVVLSRGIFGPEDTEFDQADQHVLGLEWAALPDISLAAEYVYNDGFQPFVGIQEASDTSVVSHVLILGGEGRF